MQIPVFIYGGINTFCLVYSANWQFLVLEEITRCKTMYYYLTFKPEI